MWTKIILSKKIKKSNQNIDQTYLSRLVLSRLDLPVLLNVFSIFIVYLLFNDVSNTN
jgi:hypothetical protein